MKKLLTVIALIGVMSLSANSVFAQAQRQLNFGLIGASFEIPVATDITIAPAAGTDFYLNYLALGVKANYYFDNAFGLPDDWDVYGGANLGYALGLSNNSNGLALGLQVGGRWFWNEKWGVFLELGGGSTIGATGGLGLTLKM
jgi:hypothetical protein